MKHRNLLIAGGAAAVVLAGVALANPGHDRMAKLDTNADGKVQVAEIEAQAAQRAAAIDANADGNVTVEEIKAHREKLRAERQQARLLKLDANGDGRVSTEEFASGHAARAAKLDADNDGVITQDEFRAGHRGRGHRGWRGHAD